MKSFNGTECASKLPQHVKIAALVRRTFECAPFSSDFETSIFGPVYTHIQKNKTKKQEFHTSSNIHKITDPDRYNRAKILMRVVNEKVLLFAKYFFVLSAKYYKYILYVNKKHSHLPVAFGFFLYYKLFHLIAF